MVDAVARAGLSCGSMARSRRDHSWGYALRPLSPVGLTTHPFLATRFFATIRYQLLYPLAYDLSPFHDTLAAERINVRPVASPEELAPQTERTTFLLRPESRAMFNLAVLRRFVLAGGAIVALGGLTSAVYRRNCTRNC